MTDKQLKLAAQWIYKNRNTGYWTFPILVYDVSRRPGTEKLKLSLDDASSVFASLETKGILLKQDGQMLSFGSMEIQMYRIDYSRLKELRKFSEIPFYYFLPPSWVYYIEKYWSWIVVCIILVVTSFLQGFVGKIGEWLGEKLTGK